jgi:hypothetical protein
VLGEGDLADGPVAGFGAGEQLGPPVAGVGTVLGQAIGNEQVGDALDALAGHAHAAADLGHGARLVEHAAEHLPPGRRQPALGGEPLGDLQEAAVEPERGDDDVGQQPAGFGMGRRVGPVLARRDGGRHGAGGAHALAWACMRTGNAAGSPRWKRSS